MPQRTQLIFSDNPGAVPASYPVPPNLDLELASIVAKWDGSAAASTFYACLSVYSQDGRLVGRFFPQQPFVAGDTGTVTYAPFLGGDAATNISPTPSVDDYVFKNANVTVTGIGFNSQANLVIQGNPVVLDGLTRVKVEFYSPCIEIVDGANNQAIGIELWDGTTNIGVIAYIAASRKTDATALLDVAYTCKAEIILTPAAGTHTYALYAWRNVAGGGTTTVFGSTFVDGTGSFGPAWYRVTAT